MAKSENDKTYDLTAPDGTKVSVNGEGRRDVLVGRGYTEGKASKTSGDK